MRRQIANDPRFRSWKKRKGENDPFLKMLSAWAVAKLKPEDKDATTKAAELIVAGWKHDNPNVRQGAAKALLELDAPRDVVGPPLLAAMDDPNPEVQDNVYRALASLGEAILPRVTERLKDPATQEKALRG